MISRRVACLGAFPLIAATAGACSNSVSTETGATTGSGGHSATSSSSSVTASSSSGATASSSSGSGGTGGADIGQPSSTYPAPHPSPPQVIDVGGPVLASPRIVPVFFADYDPTLEAAMSTFEGALGSTMYWSAAVSEYGVGAATTLPPVVLTEMSPTTIDDSGIQTWLQGKLNGDDPAWPAADANTVYVLHYPATSTITLQGAMSCSYFGGYHSDTLLDANHAGLDVSYAVIPTCPNFAMMSTQDATTSTISHELAEAATDPYPMTNPAYVTVDTPHYYWERLLGGGEVGDMCAQFADSFTNFAEMPAYMVQRIWSDKSALAGRDPCQPALPGEVYFNSAPDLADNITASVMGMSFTLKGAKIAVGSSKTIDLDLFSEGPTSGPWTVTVRDVSSAIMNGPELLTFSLDASAGQNGQKIKATITVKAAGKHNTETFIVDSALGQVHHPWIGIVGQM